VKLDNGKIVLAESLTDVLGAVSANPAIIGDTGEMHWSGKFLTDDFGRALYEDVIVPAEYDEDGVLLREDYIEKQQKINPDWDSGAEYIPRSQRPEWSAVGVVGKLRVRDDGFCEVGGLCKPAKGGTATKCQKGGYRVLKRISDNVILIWVR
jgi:hypothetical protein